MWRMSAPSTPKPTPGRRPEPVPVQPHIDDPMALLRACHDKVRHFTGLAQRLHTHVRQHGADKQARDAAQAVLRYFQVAAPLHHADEALNLFPALHQLGDAELTRHAHRLEAEHAELDALWAPLSVALSQVAQGQPWPDTGPDATPFAERYLAHAQAEETLLYPHAARLPADTLRQLAEAMVARRSPP
jgi:hemerythrin-like domain-containing protein